MVTRSWLLGVLLIFSFPFLCASQECMSACAAGLTVCSSLTYDIYVTNSSNLSDVMKREATAKSMIVQTNFNSVGASCSAFFQNFICNMVHPACNGSNPTPIKPCISLCDQYIAVCGPVYGFLPAQWLYYLSCDGPDYINGGRLYAPRNDTQCSYSTNKTSPCPYNETSLLYSGSCQPYNSYGNTSLNLTSSSICAPFVGKQIYVPVDWPRIQIPINFLFISGEYLLRFQKAYPIMPLDCYEHLVTLICGTYFPTCISVSVPQFNTTVHVGQKPCQSFCDQTISKCWDFFKNVNLTYLLVNCSIAYPETTPYLVPVGNTYTVGSCRNEVFPPDPAGALVMPKLSSCPTAFGLKTEYSDDESRCGLSCPDSSYTKEEWHRLVKVTQAGSSLSLIFMSFLIISYSLNFEKRKFPSSIHFWEFVATAGFAISFLINGKNPEKDVWCKDPGTSATQSNNAACGAQGFLFIFFGLSLAAWCLATAFAIFYGVVQNKKVGNLARYSKLFHVFCWGGPLIFAIAALASKSIGYGPPLAWCFIHFEGFGYNDGNGVSNDYPLFYIPMLVLFVVIIILFIATVGKIIYIRKMKVGSYKGLKSRTFQAQIRVLIFILVVFVICVSIFEWRFEIEGAKSKERVGLDWAYCKMQIALNVEVDPNECSGETNPARIQYSRTVGECFVLSGIGLLIFVGFGADIGIYKHWYKIGKLTSKREWYMLKDFITHGKDPFSSGKTRTTSSNSPNPSKDSKDSKDSNSKNSQHRDSIDNDDDVELSTPDSLDLESNASSTTKQQVYKL